MKIEIPIRIYSEANNGYSWRAKLARKKAQQKEFVIEWKNAKFKPSLPCTVIFTRHASRVMDTDNLAIGFKAVRDALAKEIGVDDGSDLISFEYRQEKLAERKYFITVEILES